MAENISVSGLINTTIQQINLDSIIEEVLDPPPSRSFVESDWSGSGIEVVGDVRFGLYNSMARATARKKSAFVLEAEIPGSNREWRYTDGQPFSTHLISTTRMTSAIPSVTRLAQMQRHSVCASLFTAKNTTYLRKESLCHLNYQY